LKQKISIAALVACTFLSIGVGRSGSYFPSKVLASQNPIQDRHTEVTEQKERVGSLNPSGMPFLLSIKEATEADGRGLSSLVYSIKNNTDSSIERIQLRVYIFNSDGQLTGGEGWIEDVKVKPYSTKKLSIVLRNKVGPEDRTVAILESVGQRSGMWTINSFELFPVLAGYLYKNSNELPRGEFRPGQVLHLVYEPIADAGGSGGSYCSSRLQEARDSCGSGGIASFSCNPSTGAWAFACR